MYIYVQIVQVTIYVYVSQGYRDVPMDNKKNMAQIHILLMDGEYTWI